tara:strand:+ start:2842 stop:3492 length:651 start_codon:yes stop_codon:yes gene_type:complete
MKIIFFLIIFIIQFVINFASADVKKFLGDPNPVDHVFDCINPEEKFENVIQIGFNKIYPIEDIYGEKKDLVYQPGLGDGLGFTSFGPSISLAKLYNDLLYWSEYSVGMNRDEGSYTIYTLNLNEMNLSSKKNKEIILNVYSWDVKGAPAPLLRKLFMDINDLINGDYETFAKKVQEIDDAFEVQLSPMSDFSKFKNKDPDFSWSYVCNLGKYIPEN